MKNFGIKFIISVVVGLISLSLLLMGYSLYAVIGCNIAFILNTSEVKEYSSIYQFVNFHFNTFLLGVGLDLLIGDGNYFYTICMVVFQFTGIFRLEGLHKFLTGRFVVMEIFGLTGTYSLYLYAGLSHPGDWRGWALPIVPILFMTYIGTDIITRSFKQKKAAANASPRSTELGKKAPGFSLDDIEGKKVSLTDFQDKNHVLLIFVRGDWCPTCHIMIRAYELNREKFLEKGIIPIGISPDSTEVNKKMMERLGWKNMLLADTNQEVADQYGILFTNNNVETSYQKGIALPASFLVDKNGVLRYMSRSDKAGEFLSPSLIFPIIDNLN